jgi:hypothetical protein
VNITEKQLIEIISEEIDRMVENDEIDENVLDRLKATAAGATATLNPFASQGDAALKKAASTMNSYSNHLLKLQQKLDLDAQKLGIADIDDIKQVSNTIKQTQQKVQDVAKTAPKSEKFKAAVQRAIADRSGGQGGQQQAAPAPGQQQAAPAPGQQQAAPAPGQQQAAPAPASGQQQAAPAPAPASGQQQATATPAAPALDNRLQAWVDGGKQAGRITASQARTAMGTTRMGQRAGKSVFNSEAALEYAQQVAAALGDRAPSPLTKAIEDTVDVGVVSESAPLSEEIHQNIMNELDLWEQSLQPLSPETLEEQLQNISKRWGFIK